jgi:hypothetical protein
MANTVSILSYANTFGDWIVTTNALARENNDLAANNFIKPTGTLYLNDPSLGLQVANVAIIQGQLQVQGTGSSAYIQRNLRVDQQVYFTNTILGLTNTGQMNVGGIILALASGTGISVSNNATIGGTLTVTGQSNLNGVTYVNNDLYVSGNTNISNTVQITGTTNVSNNITITGNTTIGGHTTVGDYLNVTNNITGNNIIIANNTTTNIVQANTSVNTTILLVNTEYANNILANTITVNTALNITGTATFGSLVATSGMQTPSLNVSSLLDANNASGFFNNLQVGGQFTVAGNFVINGSTVYNSNVFTLNAGSGIALPSQFNVNRGSSGANASIRWNESQLYWDLNDVSTDTYYRLLTTQQLNNTLTSNSTLTAATANVANILNTYVTSAYNKANAANVLAQAAFDKANTESGTFNGTTGQATPTNGVITYSSTNGVTVTGSSNTLTINTPQDVRTTASPTFNSLTLTNALSINQGGTGATSASQALTNILPTGTTAGYVLTTGGPGSFYWAAGGGGGGGGATPGTTIQSTRLSYTGDGANTVYTAPTYIPGNSQLRVYIDGVRQFPSAYTETSNTVVTLGTAAPSGSSILLEVDGYVVNPYYANNIAFTVNSNISGTANTIQLAIDGLTSKLITNYALNSYVLSAYNQANSSSTLAQAAYNQANTATTQIIPITQGGTNATSATQALNNLLPSGQLSGYVLTTGGAGSYYWAAAGGGGGATPGTTINTTRIYPTVNAAQTLFATPTYTPGSGQLRVYINGVRQFGSEYTETSNTSVTLGTGATAGDVILLEVDGYINNPYYANTIAFTVNSNISATANTIQLAIDGLTSKLVTYYANTSSSYSNPTWITSLASTKITGTIPAANISGLATSATTDTTNASNISSGTLGAGRLPYTMNQSVSTANNVQFNSLGVGTAASGTTGEVRAIDNITAYYSSDISLKENVNDITNAVDIVYQIGGKTFDWTDEYIQEHGGEDGYFVQKSDFGVIAQDVQKVFPLAIRTRPDGLLAVDYEKLCALAFAAIKELKDEIEILKGNSK